MMSLYYDVARAELLGCRSCGAIMMSLVRSCWDVARAELLGCRSEGAIGMALLRSYWDGARAELLGCRSEGAIIGVQHQRCDITINIDGKGI